MSNSSYPSPSAAVRRVSAFIRHPAVFTCGIAASIFLASILLRLPFFQWPLTGDEGNYAYTAYRWSRGQTLYVDFLGLEKPQGLYFAYSASQFLFGCETWAIRLWGALWAGATGIVLYRFGRDLFTRGEAFLAALLFTLFACAPQIEGFTSNAEVFMILPLVLSAGLLWRQRFGLAGFWSSVALLFKFSAVAGLALAAFWLLYRRTSAKAWFAFVLGAVFPLAAAFLHGAWTAGVETYLYNVYLFRIQVGWEYITSPLGSLISRLPQTAPVWFPLGCFSFFGFSRFPRDTRWFLLAWIATSLLGVSIGGDWNLHYFVQLVPALAVPAAAGILLLLRAKKPTLRFSMIALIAVSLIWLMPPFLQTPEEGTRNLYHRIGIETGEEIGAYLRERTTETDSIYVAFYQANVYHQARRTAAVPFLSRVQLLFVPGAFDRLISALQDQRPAYVVVLDQHLDDSAEEKRFLDALSAGYGLETIIQGVGLYRRLDMTASPSSP